MINGIQNVIFDFGGVIVDLTRNRCLEAFEQLGVESIRDLLLNNYRHKDFFMQLESGTISPATFREEVRHLSRHPLTDKQIDTAWMAMLAEVSSEKLELLLKLKDRYHTMLLSNTNSIHWEWSEQHLFTYKDYRAADFFHRIYLSYKLHLLKPDREIFEYVLRDAAIRPEETLFIDDALPNCQAAEALGICTYMPQKGTDWLHLFD